MTPPRKLIPTPSSQRVIDLRDQGLTYEAIGDACGISRQRVHQILTRWAPRQLGRTPSPNPKGPPQ